MVLSLFMINRVFLKKVYYYSVAVLVLSSLSSCSTNKNINETQLVNPYKNYTYGAITGKKPLEWNTEEGKQRLIRTKYNKTFFSLANHFSGQRYPSTCGPASAKIVISAIYDKSNEMFLKDSEYSFTEEENGRNYDKYIMTEKNIFDPYYKQNKNNKDKTTYGIISRTEKDQNGQFNGGVSLENLTDLFNSHPNIKAEYTKLTSDDFSVEGANKFRNLVKQITNSNNQFLIVNYHLGAVYSKTSGHYSPLVAYDEKTDSVLIMEVANYLGTWVWVDLEEVYRMMNGVLNAVPRGYIVITGTSIKNDDDVVLEDNIENHEITKITAEEKTEIGDQIEKNTKPNEKTEISNQIEKNTKSKKKLKKIKTKKKI